MTKPNISKHLCSGKCSEFQCNHCLIPANSSELESAESDFLVGDVVVSTCNGIIPILFEITESPHASFDEYVRCRSMSGVISYWLAINEIRTATTAEVQANRRLEAEHALAEVS